MYNHLRNERYLGSMKPISVSVSQDPCLGCGIFTYMKTIKINRPMNGMELILWISEIFHTRSVWGPDFFQNAGAAIILAVLYGWKSQQGFSRAQKAVVWVSETWKTHVFTTPLKFNTWDLFKVIFCVLPL